MSWMFVDGLGVEDNGRWFFSDGNVNWGAG